MVKRFSFKFVAGERLAGCFNCQDKAVAICTDKVTGSEYWVCEKHAKDKGRCRKTQLHPDFRKLAENPEDLNRENQNNEVVLE